MNMHDLIRAARSYRRFDQRSRLTPATLKQLVDLGRLSASGGNLQPLKYVCSCESELNARIFPALRWAGYLSDWDGPVEGERPAGYIILVSDATVAKSAGVDHGLAAQSIVLGAAEIGLGACIIGSIDRDMLRASLDLPNHYELLLVIALGTPAEVITVDPVSDGNIRYWRDSNDVHHVPKRSLDDVLLEL